MSSDTMSTQESVVHEQKLREQVFLLARNLAAPVKLGHYDELRDTGGQLHKPWQTFLAISAKPELLGCSKAQRRLIA